MIIRGRENTPPCPVRPETHDAFVRTAGLLFDYGVLASRGKPLPQVLRMHGNGRLDSYPVPAGATPTHLNSGDRLTPDRKKRIKVWQRMEASRPLPLTIAHEVIEPGMVIDVSNLDHSGMATHRYTMVGSSDRRLFSIFGVAPESAGKAYGWEIDDDEAIHELTTLARSVIAIKNHWRHKNAS